MALYTQKNIFEIPSFSFASGRVLPVRMGYETFGTPEPRQG